MNMRWFMVASWIATIGILLHVSCTTTEESSKEPVSNVTPSPSPDANAGPSFIETSIDGTDSDNNGGDEGDRPHAQASDPEGFSNENAEAFMMSPPSPSELKEDSDFSSVPSFLDSICVGFDWVRSGHCNWCKPEKSNEVVTQHQCSIPAQCGEGEFGAAGWGYSYKKCS